MNSFAASALLRRWVACLLASLLWCSVAALGQPTQTAPAAEASDRQALLERLREAQTRLSDLEQNIRELERRLVPAPQASATASEPEPDATDAWPALPTIPVHWLWLSVLTIVILMIGITYSGRPARKHTAAPASADEEGMTEFQTRLGRLDLSLDPLADTQHPPAEPDRHRP